MPLIAKAVAVAAEVAVTGTLASSATDGAATRIALYAAAAAGLAWFWRNVLRPVAKVLHRTVGAVETLEELPAWRALTDRRVAHLERNVTRIKSGQDAILRELGLEDRVRRTYADDADPDDEHGAR